MSATLLSNPFANTQETATVGGKWLPPAKTTGKSRIIYVKAVNVHRTVKSTDSFAGSFIWVTRAFLAGSQVQSTLRGQVKANLFPLYDFHQAHTLKNSLLGRIRGLLDLAPGWDGYRAKIPAATAIDEAEQFTSNVLPADDFQLPTVTAAADGEVNFSWKNSLGYIDLGFYGDGSYSYYAKTAVGHEFMSDESSLTEHLPEQVLTIIRGI
jgi:hypothetical protein